ncbi:PE-PGRS family protein [Streptomyces adustus]|uniref:PE-PGRS family protein n=1 Tax=Streptomyces adustus TaxID=1609272 RepID=A0A5N8V6F5_9ACTN|nr:PE-PGRS family protein [Streptomyces adustus]MPY30737.1 PE-PGRS family protein [Streptomyces adustus]
MRNVNPEDLDHLAKLLDGRGGVRDRLDEAFTRAARLGVTADLTSLKPLRTWLPDTASDLRRRAAIARLEDGDLAAGLKWAGFDTEDIARAAFYLKAPGVLLLANALATDDAPGTDAFRRRSGESLDDWVDRMRAHGIAGIPALKPYEPEIAELLGDIGDVKSTLRHGGLATFHGVNLTKILVGNSVTQGYLSGRKMWAADLLKRLPGRYTWAPGKFTEWGNRLAKWEPPVRSLSAPGSWLPGKLAGFASRNGTYQDVARVPFVNSQVSTRVGDAFDVVRRSQVMNGRLLFGMSGNKIIDGLVGSDRLARMYGGLTHAGKIPGRAGNASYWKVGKSVYQDARLFGKGRFAAAGEGFRVAGRMGGALRAVGVAGGVFATVYSGANVWSQGDPRSHFGSRTEGAKYVGDVSETLFNASLTAATVAPNPFTIGAVVVTGGVYAGAKVVEHWDDIKKASKRATKWVDGKAGDLGKSIARSKANPMNWF